MTQDDRNDLSLALMDELSALMDFTRKLVEKISETREDNGAGLARIVRALGKDIIEPAIRDSASRNIAHARENRLFDFVDDLEEWLRASPAKRIGVKTPCAPGKPHRNPGQVRHDKPQSIIVDVVQKKPEPGRIAKRARLEREYLGTRQTQLFRYAWREPLEIMVSSILTVSSHFAFLALSQKNRARAVCT